MNLNIKDKEIEKEFVSKGFLIKDIIDTSLLDKFRKSFLKVIYKDFSKDIKALRLPDEDGAVLNNFHKFIAADKLNSFRLKVYDYVNSLPETREIYYSLCKNYLDIIVGNELAIQQRINLSIQLPKDNSSLLPIHSDTWSGDSPFEIVVWLPLVDCYKTKSMYILKSSQQQKVKNLFFNKKVRTSEEIYKKIKKDILWLNVKYGQVLIFNQNLPHGNIVNVENETRWSLNCRFKGLFTPYGDKKIGEFFLPLNIKPASRIGMDYQYPKKV
jgi:sporadic carbohydrate cluster 2OG-Fe(II) oxygenase